MPIIHMILLVSEDIFLDFIFLLKIIFFESQKSWKYNPNLVLAFGSSTSSNLDLILAKKS